MPVNFSPTEGTGRGGPLASALPAPRSLRLQHVLGKVAQPFPYIIMMCCHTKPPVPGSRYLVVLVPGGLLCIVQPTKVPGFRCQSDAGERGAAVWAGQSL